jgi:hypothetical protein
MKIMLINNSGGGFADYTEVPHGTTVQELFEREMGQEKAGDWMIRVNRQPCTRDQVLVEGDRISITPCKIQVAA